MIALIQRCRSASVSVRGDAGDLEPVGAIGRGLCVLLGVEQGDAPPAAAEIARRIARLRVFPDAEGRMNLDLAAVGGAVLLVSQFTLCGDCSRGHRPSFVSAAPPAFAEPLVEMVAAALRTDHGVPVETGRFRSEMLVSIENDGPVTVILRRPPAPSGDDQAPT
jgi:D-tyrosyl-tRNA(Tyr) deacylase